MTGLKGTLDNAWFAHMEKGCSEEAEAGERREEKGGEESNEGLRHQGDEGEETDRDGPRQWGGGGG